MHRGDPNEIAVEERGREGEGEEEGAVGGRDPEAHEGEDGLVVYCCTMVIGVYISLCALLLGLACLVS